MIKKINSRVSVITKEFSSKYGARFIGSFKEDVDNFKLSKFKRFFLY